MILIGEPTKLETRGSECCWIHHLRQQSETWDTIVAKNTWHIKESRLRVSGQVWLQVIE